MAETRKLAALMFTDMVGFSRQMGANEASTLRLLAVHNQVVKQAIAEEERAVTLHPNNADGSVTLGVILAFAGRPEEGIEWIERGMRLNPHYPVSYLLNLSFACRLAGRYEEALAPGKRFLVLTPNSAPGHFNMTVIYSELGREEEARAEVAELLRLNPNSSLEWVRQTISFKDPEVLERHLAALRRAGLK